MEVRTSWGTMLRLFAPLCFAVVVAGHVDFEPAQTKVNVTLMLGYDHDRLSTLLDLASNVSTPGHPQRGQYVDIDTVASMLAPHPEADAAVVAWRDSRKLSHCDITQPHPLFRVLTLTVAEAADALQSTCTLHPEAKSGRFAGHHALNCTAVDAAMIASPHHVTHVTVGGHVKAHELARQRKAANHARQPRSSPTNGGVPKNRARRQGLSSPACQNLTYNGGFNLWQAATAPYIPIPMALVDGPTLPNTDSVTLAQLLEPSTLLSLNWALNFYISYFSGYSGSAFSAGNIPFPPAAECIFPMPVDTSRVAGCPHSPFGPEARAHMITISSVTVYFNSTPTSPIQTHRAFTFGITALQNSCTFPNSVDVCTIDGGSINYTFSGCDLQITMPEDLWFGEFYLTVAGTNSSGYTIAQTSSTVYFSGPNSATVSRVAPTTTSAQKLVMPTQAAAFYGSEDLAVVRSGRTLTGSTPSVLLLDGAYSPTDFANLITASNNTAYTRYPLQPMQIPTMQFVTQAHVNTTMIRESSIVQNTFTVTDDDAPPEYRTQLDAAHQNLLNGRSGTAVNHPNNPGEEFSLDTQFVGSISRAQMAKAYTSGYFFGAMAAYLNQFSPGIAQMFELLGTLFAALYATTPPDVISMSFGFDITPGRNPPLAQMIVHIEPVLAALGARGVTVIAASGDGGAFADSSTFSYNSSANTWAMPFQCVRSVFWPAASPHVTAVGATQIVRASSGCPSRWPPGASGSSSCVTEIPSSSFTAGITSGGGFSNVGSRPQWQDAAVNGYRVGLEAFIASRPASDGSYFTSDTPDVGTLLAGRGYPDVAAVGHFCNTIQNGALTPMDGTSCSAPLFAGMVSLLNSQLASQGKPPLGFLNPTLYGAPASVFNDVTTGNNGAPRGVPGTSCTNAYPAGPGWDAVSGRGTVKLQPLLQYHLSANANSGGGGGGGNTQVKLSAADDVGVAIAVVVLVLGGLVVALFLMHSKKTEDGWEPVDDYTSVSRAPTATNPTYEYASGASSA
eukprot:m.59220 g.59220  ORF g.59220 m.59220 type:complete len:1014 (+) comp9451_c0_seq1:84-3125(+)